METTTTTTTTTTSSTRTILLFSAAGLKGDLEGRERERSHTWLNANPRGRHTTTHSTSPPDPTFSPTPPPPPEKGESNIVRCHLFLKRVFLRNKWQQQRTARERPLPISQNSATKHERGWEGKGTFIFSLFFSLITRFSILLPCPLLIQSTDSRRRRRRRHALNHCCTHPPLPHFVSNLCRSKRFNSPPPQSLSVSLPFLCSSFS